MKHLKLYEAFESTKLGKTLRFIKIPSSKEAFLNNLKSIGDFLDFPISNFKDDYFEYLPFKAALKKNIEIVKKEPEGPKQCTATSLQSFGREAGIEGESCQGGRVKRKWGAGTRTVTCVKCKGTGFEKVKPVIETPKLGLIKFWFDKDGKFITVTGTDGQVRPQPNSASSNINLKAWSRDINDYNIGKNLSSADLIRLPTGTIVYFKANRYGESTISFVIHNEDRRRAYLLQDNFEGSGPEDDGLLDEETRRKFARYAWCVSGGGDMTDCKLLTPKVVAPKVEDEKDEVTTNWYDYNNLINVRNMGISNQRDMETRLKDSHFAIVLDFDKLEEAKFTPKSEMRDKRRTQKLDVLKFKNPEDIKKANLARYIDTLSKNFNIGKGLTEVSKILPRSLGWANSMIFLIQGTNISDIGYVISRVYQFMRSNDEGDKQYQERDIVNRLKPMYERTSIFNLQINTKISKANKSFLDLQKHGGNKDAIKLANDIFNAYLDLGVALNKKISIPTETLTDIEVIYSKLLALRQMWSSERFLNLRRLRYVNEYISSSYDYDIVNEIMDISTDNQKKVLEELIEFKSVIEKY